MDKKTKGAWIIHHGQKLQATLNQDFDAISFSAKCGTLLSAISADKQNQIPLKRLDALARANHISPKTELPSILTELERQRLISNGKTGVEVLGLTGHAVLDHTASIFDESNPDGHEGAVIDVSEIASESPITEKQATQFISDTYALTSSNSQSTIELATSIGFFDSESISKDDKLLFNGNLFRRDQAKKVNGILASLKPAESKALLELNEKLKEAGCLPLGTAKRVLGDELFAKLHSIGMFDVSVVGNESGKNYFVTRPAAFSKFTDTIADDALDLAKAFVASLTYGMTQSGYYRGRIQMISALMGKLIAGGIVGPATAIGCDYQALELKGVVQVTPAHSGMFTMRLLKPDVGRLALAVIQDGDITAESVPHLPGANVTQYLNPENTREQQRRISSEAVRLSTRNLLNEIRTGGL